MLCDFGHARFTNVTGFTTTDSSRSNGYVAPEILFAESQDAEHIFRLTTKEADVYAFAMVALLVGTLTNFISSRY